METPLILKIIISLFPWGYLKIGLFILTAMYLIFAAVIVRQERLMSKVVEIPFSPILRTIALIHLFAAIGALVLTLFV